MKIFVLVSTLHFDSVYVYSCLFVS